ncbi:MAG TPA: hypothetical protein VEM41_12290 [Actinomycetota bacterium]|nr:hypothetical protein [Actinomycetota bacterium]
MAAAVTAVAVAAGVVMLRGVSAAQVGRRAPVAMPGHVQLFYTAPVLVRAGERVLVPIDAICASVKGVPCRARVTMRAAAGLGALHEASASASPGLRFDLSAVAARALAGGGTSGSIRFSIEAVAGGARAALPAEAGSSLRFYVAKSIPPVRVPSIPFGRVRRGRTVLSLPWGTGAMRAGIALGGDGVPTGPSSFDVDRWGRVLLLDTEQSRLETFADGELVRATTLPLVPRSDVAASRDGGAAVLVPGVGGRVDVRRVVADGSSGTATDVPMPTAFGIAGAIRMVGEDAFVHLFPLDAWMPVAGSSSAGAATGLTVGEPLTGGRQLVSVVRGRRVRLGTVAGGRVRDAVELSFGRELGELSLAAPDGAGGYVVVVHVWHGGPRPADAFQVVHVARTRIASTFLVPSHSYTVDAPQSVFRLGPGGLLYQLRTLPSGVQVVRYGIGGGS